MIKRLRFFGVWWLILAVTLVACQQILDTRPLKQRLVVAQNPVVDIPTTSINIDELVQSPEIYAGRRIQVLGQFTRNPLIICTGHAHASPARWNLSNQNNTVRAGGVQPQLRELAPQGLTVTVVGRWLHWRGYSGCEKTRTPTEHWYLAIERVLSPNPITQATLTPGAAVFDIPVTPVISGTQVADTDTQGQQPGSEPTAAANTPAPAPTNTSIPSVATQTPAAAATQTPVATISSQTATPTLTPSTTPSPDATGLTLSPTPANGNAGTPTLTPSVTVTGSTGTQTPAATATELGTGQNTATPTATTEGESGFTDMGELESQNLAVETLIAGEIHQWDYLVESSDILTVNVASPIDVDIVVSIVGPSGNVLATQNSASLGQPERLVGVPLPTAGTYMVLISEATGRAGAYGMILEGQDAYTYIFQGTLGYGDSDTTDMGDHVDHFWHFMGNAGDVITIQASPNDGSDLFIELYDHEAFQIDEAYTNDGFSGDPEVLTDFTLPTTGFYAIRIGEYGFLPCNYTISLARQ